MKKVRNVPLILGDKTFINIEDLKNDFNVNDILSSYYNGNLKIWLSYKYNDLAEELEKIDKSEGHKKIIESIIRIFFKDDENLDTIIEDACFIIENTVDIKINENKEELENYINQYNSIVNSLFNFDIAVDDYDNIKKSLEKLYNEYNGLFNYYYEDFFYKFYNQKNYYVILSILANKDIRRIFLLNKKTISDIDKMFTHNIKNCYSFYEYMKLQEKIDIRFIMCQPIILDKYNFFDKVEKDIIFLSDKEKILEYLIEHDIYITLDSKTISASIDIELSLNREKLNVLYNEIKDMIMVSDMQNSDLNKLIENRLEFEFNNIVDNIKCNMIDETGIKHLFDFYEFRIFDVEISNFYQLKNMKIYREDTEDNFKTITDKKCLILHLDKNAVIKSLDDDKEYDIDSVNGYFHIFNGINYKGNKYYNELVYMEI